MKAAHRMIKETYGGAGGYMKSKCGLSDTDLDLIRKHLMAA